jgi:hypothetical protein
MSGGREHAAAYVSPSTLSPAHGSTPVTAAIKVHEIVESAVRAYQTEPSLLRRRASSLPPPIRVRVGQRSGIIAGAATLGLALGIFATFLGVRALRTRDSAAVQLPSLPENAEPAPHSSSNHLRNGSSPGPTPMPVAASGGEVPPLPAASASPAAGFPPAAPPTRASLPATLRTKTPKPATSRPASPSPSPSPAQPTSAAPKSDLWLE